ncbi:cell envelope integrity protein TolA [Vibrio harveyi]|uniref:cell envelope integrity protein TolA n=1 Tax=Vibrio harveyi TaxID=669 RepID=UPI003CF5B67A
MKKLFAIILASLSCVAFAGTHSTTVSISSQSVINQHLSLYHASIMSRIGPLDSYSGQSCEVTVSINSQGQIESLKRESPSNDLCNKLGETIWATRSFEIPEDKKIASALRSFKVKVSDQYAQHIEQEVSRYMAIYYQMLITKSIESDPSLKNAKCEFTIELDKSGIIDSVNVIAISNAQKCNSISEGIWRTFKLPLSTESKVNERLNQITIRIGG